MKFGKRLISEMNHQYGPTNYIQYSFHKRVLKSIFNKRESVAPPNDVQEVNEYFEGLLEAINNIIKFYESQLEKLLVDYGRLVSLDGPGLLKLYCETKALREYRSLNIQGVSNLNKKVQKRSAGREQTTNRSTQALQTILSSRLGNSELEDMLTAISTQYSSSICHGNSTQAQESLELAWKQDERSQARVASLQNAAFFQKKMYQKEARYALKVITGNSNPVLANDVCEVLGTNVESNRVGTFANGEIDIKLGSNVRGDDVFIVQTTSGNSSENYDVNKSLMELLLLMHTLRLASAKRITAVVPYLAYSRQDRKTEARVPISASAVAQMMMAMGMDRLITVDLHCGQIQGFFANTPVDNLYASKEFVKYLQENIQDMSKVCVVSPDAGGVERARLLADCLGAPNVVTILKRRVEKNKVDSMQIVGDVKDQLCIIVDDMIDTAGTLVKAADLLGEHGASKVYACATHGLLTDPACARINACKPLEQVIVTDSIPQSDNLERCSKLHVLTLAPLLAEAIYRIHNEISLSELFQR